MPAPTLDPERSVPVLASTPAASKRARRLEAGPGSGSGRPMSGADIRSREAYRPPHRFWFRVKYSRGFSFGSGSRSGTGSNFGGTESGFAPLLSMPLHQPPLFGSYSTAVLTPRCALVCPCCTISQIHLYLRLCPFSLRFSRLWLCPMVAAVPENPLPPSTTSCYVSPLFPSQIGLPKSLSRSQHCLNSEHDSFCCKMKRSLVHYPTGDFNYLGSV